MKRLNNRSKPSSGSLTWWDTLTTDNKCLLAIFTACISVSEGYFLFKYLFSRYATLIEALFEGGAVGILFGIVLFPISIVVLKVLKMLKK